MIDSNRMLKYIDWNIKCYCKIDLIINFLKTKMSKCNCVVALQEVMPDKPRLYIE